MHGALTASDFVDSSVWARSVEAEPELSHASPQTVLRRDRCAKCGEHATNMTAKSPYCKRCRRDKRMMIHYGLSAVQVDALIAKAEGRCPLCKKQTTRWSVDHDHTCCPGKKSCGDCVRGVICDLCNRGIGFFQDDPASMRRAAEYVESYVLTGHADIMRKGAESVRRT